MDRLWCLGTWHNLILATSRGPDSVRRIPNLLLSNCLKCRPKMTENKGKIVNDSDEKTKFGLGERNFLIIPKCIALTRSVRIRFFYISKTQNWLHENPQAVSNWQYVSVTLGRIFHIIRWLVFLSQAPIGSPWSQPNTGEQTSPQYNNRTYIHTYIHAYIHTYMHAYVSPVVKRWSTNVSRLKILHSKE